MPHAPSAVARRTALAAAAALTLAACGGGKSETANPMTDSASAAGPDSAVGSITTQSVPPTAQDSSVAAPRAPGATDTNSSGMGVQKGDSARP